MQQKNKESQTQIQTSLSPQKEIMTMAHSLAWVALIITVVMISACANPKAASKGGTAEVGIRDDDIVRGNRESDIVIVEYTDIECPACSYFHTTFTRTWPLIANDVMFVLRHYPLTNIHPYSMKAAQYVEAARLQGDDKYYSLYIKMIENQSSWADQSASEVDKIFDRYIEESSLDLNLLKSDAKSGSIAKKIAFDISLGKADGLQGTPTLLINSEKVATPQNPNDFYRLIDNARKKLREKPSS